jgi:hypothetical protein
MAVKAEGVAYTPLHSRDNSTPQYHLVPSGIPYVYLYHCRTYTVLSHTFGDGTCYLTTDELL